MEAQPLPVENGGSIPTVRLLKSQWEVGPCKLELAQSLVRRWHYAHGGSNTAVLTCGLWRRGQFMDADCYGVTWWIPPTGGAAAKVHPENPNGVLALSRVAVRPDAPKNAATFLIRHSMRFIDRHKWPVLVTYADEWQGHAGKIYEALKDAGWQEDGYTKSEPCYTLNGRLVSRKAGPNTRTHADMLALGCQCVGKFRKRRFVNRTAA